MPGVTVLSAGTSRMTNAPTATPAAAGTASPKDHVVEASPRASRTPSTPPTTAETRHSGTASAMVIRSSCQRVAPRAASIADSPSRCPASSRATASSAAAASRNSSTAQMASRDRATSRSLAVPCSTAGRLVVSVRAGSAMASCSVCCSVVTFAATVVSWAAGMLAVCGWASQEPASAVSAPAEANADACTVSGP